MPLIQKYFLEKNIFGLNKSLLSINLEENNDLTTNQNAPRVYGVSSSKKGEITTINKGTFTSCGFNDGCPPWHINAESITHDSVKKQLIYKNAFLNVTTYPYYIFQNFFIPIQLLKDKVDY